MPQGDGVPAGRRLRVRAFAAVEAGMGDLVAISGQSSAFGQFERTCKRDGGISPHLRAFAVGKSRFGTIEA